MIANTIEGRTGLVPAAVGVVSLAILVALLPVLGDPEVTLLELVSAYVLLLLLLLLLAPTLPALPFIALSFVLANAEPLYESLSKADDA